MGWVEDINSKMGKEHIDLIDYFPRKYDYWLKNFFKSAITPTLIVIGFNFIFNGFIEHNEVECLLGTVAMLVSFIIIFLIDEYHKKVKKLELLAIENNQKMSEEKIIQLIEDKFKEKYE